MRPLSELIKSTEPGMEFVLNWVSDAKNPVEILPREKSRAERELFQAQVTTQSPLGAVIYETGGIIIDHGWIRILGSGHSRLNRGMMEWNKGKSFKDAGERPSFLLIGDDIVGGFFAINGGGIAPGFLGDLFYFSQEFLNWENLNVGYSDFLLFCFSGDLERFYQRVRWNGWKEEIQDLDGNKGISCYPFLFTEEGKDINKVSRTPVPIEEIWHFSQDGKWKGI